MGLLVRVCVRKPCGMPASNKLAFVYRCNIFVNGFNSLHRHQATAHKGNQYVNLVRGNTQFRPILFECHHRVCDCNNNEFNHIKSYFLQSARICSAARLMFFFLFCFVVVIDVFFMHLSILLSNRRFYCGLFWIFLFFFLQKRFPSFSVFV